MNKTSPTVVTRTSDYFLNIISLYGVSSCRVVEHHLVVIVDKSQTG